MEERARTNTSYPFNHAALPSKGVNPWNSARFQSAWLSKTLKHRGLSTEKFGFKKNTLTFNPGWDSNASNLDTFTDVRDLQRQLKAQGVQLTTEADETTTGPASFVAVDPDGNPILVDQHV